MKITKCTAISFFVPTSMKFRRLIKAAAAFVGFALIITTLGCIGFGTTVSLNHYAPAITEDLDVYKGKRVYLMNFDNQANDTSVWRYYSPDRKFGYITNDTLHNYFWYAFRDAFLKKGMLVSNMDNPDLNAPAMWVTLLSITDVQYRVRVTVQKKGVTEFTNEYTIQEPPPQEKDPTPAALEQRAYRMTNRLIATILKDSNFQKIITAPS